MNTLCALAIALSFHGSVQATKASADADLRELAAYTLTMESLNKVVRINEAMYVALKKDPRYGEQVRLQQELDALKKKDETTEAEDKRMEDIGARLEVLEEANKDTVNMGDAKNITEMAAQVQKFPPLSAALRAEGMAPRDYAKFMLAMIQAGFAAGLQKSGLLKETPEGVNPANIKFVLEHEADLKKLQGPGGML
jgi:hypothetical protein